MTDWQDKAKQWNRAWGAALCKAKLKTIPEDFIVQESMPIVPEGDGEHLWLKVQKNRQNTEQVAKALARLFNVKYRDVSYSGMKDYFAVTEQWFSVHILNKPMPDYADLDLTGVTILEHGRHRRKIKRATHTANHFRIVLRDFAADEKALNERLQTIQRFGVPNYFGEQRFGRNMSNLLAAQRLFCEGDKIKNRNLRGLALSSMRSFLFNEVVSARVANNNWQTVFLDEAVNLEGSNSFFSASAPQEIESRLYELDIHPTAPLWGARKNALVSNELESFEQAALKGYEPYMTGLEKHGLEYQRRALRIKVHALAWELQEQTLVISFTLNKGQFATSVLRELIDINDAD